ncbi:uncharacterized protein LOC144642003 [Oculina patagonica]
MVGSTLVEVCGGLIFSFTRGVAEHVNPNEAEINPESLSYNLLQSAGMEWYCQPVDELICQEYSEREVSSTEFLAPTNLGQARFINACSIQTIENSEDTEQVIHDRAMAWKKLRPSFTRTVWNSLCFGFLISVLSAAIIGMLAILVYYLNYQAWLMCQARPKQSIPIKVQWSKTISEAIFCMPIYAWFSVNTLFFFRSHQILGLKRKLFLISFVFYVLDSLYRIALQGFGISHSELTRLQRIPGNAFFLLNVFIQTWILARRFSIGAETKKFKTMLLIIVPCVSAIVVAILVAYFVYPAYNKQSKIGKVNIAVFSPLITVVLKSISRLCVQRLWRISHPGTSFVLLVPLYYGSAVMLRLLQVDLKSLKSIALIGIIHGIAEVIERSSVVLIDYIHHQIYKRRRVPWGSFRTPRRERLAADIAILSMLFEPSAVISVNGFLHLHEYFYTDNKTPLQLLQSFAITTSVPLAIEWIFTSVSIAIETRYQNRPVMAIWRRQWKRHLTVAIINALPIVVWSSTNLFIAVQARFPNIKDYCEMPFSHP